MMAKVILGRIDGAHPSGCDIGRIRELPRSVVGPLSVTGTEEALAIGIGTALGHREVGEETTDGSDKGDKMLFPTEVPVKKGTVEHKGIYGSSGVACHEIGCEEAAGRVPHEDDFKVALAPDDIESGVNVGKILV